MSRYLATRIAELDDAELLRRLAGGDQTEESIALLRAELRQRGIAEPEAAPEADDDYDDEGVSDSLVEFARYSFPIEAQLLRERLEADGVPAWVVDANVTQVFGGMPQAVGGARVMIRPDDVPAARIVMEKLDAGDYALEQEAHVRDGGRPPQAGVAPVGEPPGGMDGLPAPLRKAFLVIGLALAIGTFYVVTQLPELWWLLLWMPLFVVRRLMRRTLAK